MFVVSTLYRSTTVGAFILFIVEYTTVHASVQRVRCINITVQYTAATGERVGERSWLRVAH